LPHWNVENQIPHREAKGFAKSRPTKSLGGPTIMNPSKHPVDQLS